MITEERYHDMHLCSGEHKIRMRGWLNESSGEAWVFKKITIKIPHNFLSLDHSHPSPLLDPLLRCTYG